MKRLPSFLLLLALLSPTAIAAEKAQATVAAQTPRQVDLSAAADKKRDEVIAELNGLIKRVEDDGKAELVFRLGDAYWEKSRAAYNREYPAFDKAYQGWVDGGRKGKEPELKQFTTNTRKYKEMAIRQFASLAASKTEYRRMDEVLFMLSYLQREDGKKEDSRKNLEKLIKTYPNSTYLAEAHLALGESAFAENDIDSAQLHYSKAYQEGLKKERSSTYVYALYKLAWCDYNRKSFGNALTRFQEVVRLSEEAEQRFSQGSPAFKDAVHLKREALNDVVKAFAQEGNIDGALAYFQGKSRKDDLPALTMRLAKEFHDQGNADKEVKTYERLIALNPQDEAVPSYLGAMLLARSAANDYASLPAIAKQIAQACKAKNNTKACASAEQSLREVVTSFHKFAQSGRYKKDYAVSQELYEAYVNTFSGYEDHSRLAFYYADLLWDIGELEAAATAYARVVELDHKGENALTSAMNAVRALDKVVHNEPRPGFEEGRLSHKPLPRAAEQKLLQKGPLSPAEGELVKACDRYIALVEELGQSEKHLQDVMDVSYKAAYLFQAHQLFDDANTRFAQIIGKWPRSQMARDAVLMILDGADARKDWEQLSVHANTFAQNKALMQDEGLAKTIRKFQDGSAFNVIAAREAQSTDAQAKFALARSYEEYARSHADSTLAASALFNALLIYRDNQADNAVLRVGIKLLGMKSDDVNLLPTTLIAMSKAEENAYHFVEAAKYYERFATRYADRKEAADMLLNAGVLQLRSGNNDEAIRLFEMHLNAHPNSKDAANILMSMAVAHEQKSDQAKVNATYARLLALGGAKTEQRWRAYYTLARADAKICKDVVVAYDALAKDQRQGVETAKARAYCEFVGAEPEQQAFDKITMQVPVERVRKQIDAKKAAMEKLAKAYLSVLTFGDDEWGIAALLRAGQAQLAYVASLREIADPQGLDAEAIQIFRQELENIVAPVEIDAYDALVKAQARAFDLHVYTPYTKELNKTLAHSYPMKLSPFVWEFPLTNTVARPSDATDEMSAMALEAFQQRKETLSRWAAEQALAANKDVALMYDMIGQWELSQGRMNTAAQAFAKACEAQPPRVESCANVAAISLSFLDFKNAAKSFQTAAAADAKNPLWKTALGYAYAASGDTDKAVTELSTALSGEYKSKEGFASLCLVFRNQKSDARSALDWCTKYRSLFSAGIGDNDPMKPVITGLEQETKVNTENNGEKK